jgi:hypothetical protein
MEYTKTDISVYSNMFQSSDEIIAAIFERATSLRDVTRLWENPTKSEMSGISARAWQIADSETNVLHWGNHNLRRQA